MDPQTLDSLVITLDTRSQLLLAAAIIIMMFAIALGLHRSDFHFLKTNHRLFFGGLAAQIVALPAATLALAAVLQPSPSIALGMIVVAACPGGNVSNFMTYAARGDTAYSVSLTAGSSIIAAIWTPAAILLWSSIYPPTANLLQTIDFNRTSFVAQTTIMLAAPLGAGMAMRVWRTDIADRLRKPLALFGACLMGFVIIKGTFDFLPILIGGWALIMTPVIAHNSLAFGLGALAGKVLPSTVAQSRSLTFEVGIQNAGLAVVLLLAQLKGLGGAAAIAAVWGVWHFFSGGAMVLFYRWLDRRKVIHDVRSQNQKRPPV